MFNKARSFTQDISRWDTRRTAFLNCMFRYAENFRQDIKAWKLYSAKDVFKMFDGCPIPETNIPKLPDTKKNKITPVILDLGR